MQSLKLILIIMPYYHSHNNIRIHNNFNRPTHVAFEIIVIIILCCKRTAMWQISLTLCLSFEEGCEWGWSVLW